MAKRKKAETTAQPAMRDADGIPYEVTDAYHTLQRAHKIVGDKSLMKQVKAHAQKMAQEAQSVAAQAGMLAKKGAISEKQMSKLAGMAAMSPAFPKSGKA
jgi:hypothetical protein